MKMKAATIESFDPERGEGILRLDEDRGAVPVRFASSACRGVIPRAEVRVLVGPLSAEPGTGGPLSATFAMRADIVEAYVGAGDGEIVPTIGVTEPRPSTRAGRPVLRVPFDASSFPALETAFPEELVGTLAFGPPAPATPPPLPTHLRLLGGLCGVARRASRFRISRGAAPLGGTFVAGRHADIGAVPWPTSAAGPMAPVLQVGLVDARRIGLDRQINVFAGPGEHESIASLVPGFVRQQIATDASPFHVIACAPGARASGPASLGDVSPLAFVDEVQVFPGIIGIQSAYRAKGQAMPADVTRFWGVDLTRPGGEFRSIQAEISTAFPTVAAFDADVIFGGFSSLHAGKGPPYKRLATFATDAFDWLHGLAEQWSRVALEASLETGASRAWLHGTS